MDSHSSQPRDPPADILRYITKRLFSLPNRNPPTHNLAGEDRLWAKDIAQPGKPALYWAIEANNLSAVEKALTKYKQFNARGLLDDTAVPWHTFEWADGSAASESPASPVMLAITGGSMDMLQLVVTQRRAVQPRRATPHGGRGTAGVMLHFLKGLGEA